MTEALSHSGAFAKYHALGNDYLVVDAAYFGRIDAAIAKSLCDRHRGVGSDGVLVHLPSAQADLGLRIFNPDGSEAEKSGNGLRIFAHAAHRFGLCDTQSPKVEVAGHIVPCALLPARAGQAPLVRVGMGVASFDSRDIGMPGPSREMVNASLLLPSQPPMTVTALSVGNPHCVLFVDVLSQETLLHLGPRIERHASFPKRINVQLAKVRDRHNIDMLVWERGAGDTQASGSSSCAVAAAARRLGYVDADVTLHMPGGRLQVVFAADGAMSLCGPVQPICIGTWLMG